MAQEPNNSGDVFGTSAQVNTGDALAQVEAEEIKRLEAQSEMQQAALGESPSAPEPLVTESPRRSADTQFRQDEMNRAATARADTAQARLDTAKAQKEAAQARASAQKVRAAATVQRIQATDTSERYAQRGEALDDFASFYTGDAGDLEEAFQQSLYENSPELLTPAARERQKIKAVQRSLAVPEEAEATGGYSAYESHVREVRAATKDVYADMGRGEEVLAGSRSYRASENQALLDAGLISEEEHRRRASALPKEEHAESLKDMFMGMDMAYAVGFGGMTSLGNFTKAVQPMVSGDSYLPGQMQEQAATSVLPVAASVISTVGALALTKNPAVALGAQFVGQSIGQGAEDLIDTYTAGHTFAQEKAGESLGIGRGGEDAAKEFADALRNVVTPAAKELAEAFARLGQSGPVTASGAAGLAPFQTAFGTAFASTVSAEDKFLSGSPFRADLRQQFGTDASSISGADYLGEAGIAAFTDDFAGMQANLGFAQAKAGRDVENPAFRRDKDFVDRYDRTSGAWQDVKDFFTWDGGRGAAYSEAQERLGSAGDRPAPAGSGEPQYLSRQDQAKAKEIADSAKVYTDAFEAHQKNEANLQYSQSGVSMDIAGLETRLLRGGGSAEYRRALPGIEAGLTHAEADITADITGMRALEKQSPNRAAEYETLIRQAAAKRSGLETEGAKLERASFDTEQQESASSFALQNVTTQAGFQRGILSGKSYAFLHGDEDRILSGEQARAAEIRREAANPILSPADRDKRLAEAEGIDAGVLSQRNDYRQNVDRQALAVKDLNIGSADLSVQQSRSFGTAGQVFSAQTGEITALRSKLSELWAEMGRGGLSADQTAARLREVTQASGQLNSVLAQQRDSRNASRSLDAETGFTVATAGLRNQIQQFGSASVAPDFARTSFADTLKADVTNRDSYTVGTDDWKRANARLVSDRARQADFEDDLNQYRPSAQTRLDDIRGQGTLRRAETEYSLNQLAPWRSSAAGANPFTASLGLERALTADITLQGRDQAKEDAERRSKQAAGVWDTTAEAGYEANRLNRQGTVDSDRLRAAQTERSRALLMPLALAETIAGSPGRGNSSAVIGFDALSALYSPNVLQGSWGHDARVHGASRPGTGVASAYDGFQNHAGATGHVAAPANSATGISTALQNLAHGMNGAQIVAVLQMLLRESQAQTAIARSSQRLPAQGGPRNTSAGAAVQAGQRSFNPARISR